MKELSILYPGNMSEAVTQSHIKSEIRKTSNLLCWNGLLRRHVYLLSSGFISHQMSTKSKFAIKLWTCSCASIVGFLFCFVFPVLAAFPSTITLESNEAEGIIFRCRRLDSPSEQNERPAGIHENVEAMMVYCDMKNSFDPNGVQVITSRRSLCTEYYSMATWRSLYLIFSNRVWCQQHLKQMTVEEKSAILSMHRHGSNSRKLQKYWADAALQIQDLWKDVMKLDLKKIDPDVRTAWEKGTLVFTRHLCDSF